MTIRTDTLVHRVAAYAAEAPERPAIHGKGNDGNWRHHTWGAYWRDVRAVARGLMALDVAPGDCVALIGDNCREWVIAQMGITAAGAIPAPIYVTNTIDQVAFILRHCRCRVAICGGPALLDKVRAAAGREGSAVERFVTMEPLPSTGDEVTSLEALMELGESVDEGALDARVEALEAGGTGLLIFTSGTTGLPKAVQLTHEGMLHVGDALLGLIPEIETSGYRVLSYLPLCHVAEQVFTNFLHLASGGQVYFCDDLKKLKEVLPEVRPTVFLGVPRVWEKFEAALRARFAEATGIKARLLRWAMRTELAAFNRWVETGRPQAGFGRKMANRLALGKIRHALGLDQIVVAATGAAPISRGTLDFFASLGLLVHEGYGMSETTGVATVSDIGRPVFGYVGRALPGVQIRIVEDGEIQLAGKNMTPGYLRQPEETAELFTEDGWLRTGDLGKLTSNGLLKITGRKKDIIITAGGKNVAPAEIEALLLTIDCVGQAVVVGDQKPYLSALIILDEEAIPALCQRLHVSCATVAEAAAEPKVRQHVEEAIERQVNPALARYQTIKRFEILPVTFSVEGGELTPTMKVRRNVVADKYAKEIERLYAG